jgi:hypothetical protein
MRNVKPELLVSASALAEGKPQVANHVEEWRRLQERERKQQIPPWRAKKINSQAMYGNALSANSTLSLWSSLATYTPRA